MEVVGVQVALEPSLEVVLGGADGSANDEHTGIRLLDLLVDGTVGSSVLLGSFEIAVRLVAEADEQEAVLLVLLDEIPRPFTQRLLGVVLVSLAVTLDHGRGRSGQHSHLQLLAELNARRMGLVRRLGRPAAPDAADADADPIREEEVVLDAVVPVPTGERDIPWLMLLGRRSRQSDQRGVFHVRIATGDFDLRMDFVVLADLERHVSEVKRGLVEEAAAFGFAGLLRDGFSPLPLLRAPVIPHDVRNRALAPGERLERLNGDVDNRLVLREQHVAQPVGGQEDPVNARLQGQGRGDMGRGELIDMERPVRLAELRTEPRGDRSLGGVDSLAERLPFAFAELMCDPVPLDDFPGRVEAFQVDHTVV